MSTEVGRKNRLSAVRQAAGISPEDFKAAFSNHPAGVAVVTADGPDGPVGLTVSSVISVSSDPPLLAFSLSSASRSTPVIASVDTIVVHLLGAGQAELAKTFATPGIDRFAAVEWTRLTTGEPILPEARVWLRGHIVDSMVVGSSTVVAVQVSQARLPGDDTREAPLVYHNRTWHHLGHHSAIA